MAENASSASIKDLKDDVAALKTAINDLTKDIKTVSESVVKDTRTRAEAAAADLRGGLDDAARTAKERGRQSAEAVRGTVAQHPLQSMLIAFGAGLVIAQLLKRR